MESQNEQPVDADVNAMAPVSFGKITTELITRRLATSDIAKPDRFATPRRGARRTAILLKSGQQVVGTCQADLKALLSWSGQDQEHIWIEVVDGEYEWQIRMSRIEGYKQW